MAEQAGPGVAAAVATRRPLDREQAVLAFNRRVLAQAERADVPLLERLRYITIVSSNLDEFFEVRFADYLEAVRASDDPASRRDMDDLAAAAHQLIDAQYTLFNDQVMPALARAGIVILNHAQRTAAQRRWVARVFQNQVRPLLVPVGLDPAHPFPLVANKSLNFIVRLGGRDAFGRENRIAIVKVPRALPRVMRLPDELCRAGQQGFVLLSSMIRANLAALFPGRTVETFSQFRVTRDSDLEVDEDDVTNLRQALRSGLTTRHFGQAIRLEVVNTCPPELSQMLLEQFSLPEAALYRVNGPVNLVRLEQLIDQAEADVGQVACCKSAITTNNAPAMGKRILRKVSGSTWPADSFATTKPVAHSTTKRPGAKAIQFGAGFMLFPMPSFMNTCECYLEQPVRRGVA